MKVVVKTDHLCDEDIQFIRSVDLALADAAKLMNKKHYPLMDEKTQQVKFTIYAKYSKRKKQSIINGGFSLSANFLLSSVYDYEANDETTYYGINFVVPRSQKKPVISVISKPKKKEEKGEKDEKDEEEDDDEY